MRNLIKISHDCSLHYTSNDVVTNYSGHVSKDVVSAEGAGLDIPLDDINDIFWVTDDVSDWFLNKADVSGYFDEFDDKGNLIIDVDHQEIASTVKGDIDTNEAPALKKPAIRKLHKLEDQQLIRRNKITEDTLPLDEAAMERKLTDTKRKIHQAYEDKAKKQHKVKVIEFIPPPPSNSKPRLHPHPKKTRTILHRKKNKDLLFTCSQFRKNDSLSRPKKKNYKLMSEMVLAD